jgi:phosphatidylinositol alpha-1,6-mannosyltransferase
MKKLLIITKNLSLSDGLGRYSVGLIETMRKIYKLIIFSSDLSGAEEKYLKDKNIEYHKISPVKRFFNLPYNFLYSCKLLKFFYRADFIHSFSDYPQCLLPFWWPFLKKDIFVTIHGTYGILPLNNFVSRFFLKRVYRKSRKIFCVSSFTEKEILKRIKLENTVVINNGVDYEKFSRNKLTKSLIKEDKDEKIILGVGVLKYRKGYHISIPAINEVRKKYSCLKYYIIGNQGDGAYFNLLKDLVKKYNLDGNVIFLEKISEEELINFYYRADLFLLSSVYIKDAFEGFGQVYLEASACGKPVIGTYGCGAEDAIVDGETGFLVPQNDIKKTAEAVLRLLDNPDLAKKMGESGKERAKQMSWDSMAKKYINVYKNIFENK